jgi:hypothetical protein
MLAQLGQQGLLHPPAHIHSPNLGVADVWMPRASMGSMEKMHHAIPSVPMLKLVRRNVMLTLIVELSISGRAVVFATFTRVPGNM